LSETSDHGPAAGACPSCGGQLRWESVLDGDEERWLVICRCGRMRAFLPEQPTLVPEDPLRAFLIGSGRSIFPPTSPWVRVFVASVEAPNPVRWRYCHGACGGCGASASFRLQACPCEATIRALDDPPNGLAEFRCVLLREHDWRVHEGLVYERRRISGPAARRDSGLDRRSDSASSCA
jgi:hypothetical protein